jgi:hypothetical protein
VLREAEKSWADDTLSADWAVIQALMNVLDFAHITGLGD